jgi:hypothetical protein
MFDRISTLKLQVNINALHYTGELGIDIPVGRSLGQ